MTTPVTSVEFVKPAGLAGLVASAVNANTAGLRAVIASLVGNTRDVYQLPDGTWPTITRRSWLSYRWVARYDPNAKPSEAVGAVAGDQFVGQAESFLPGLKPYATPTDGA